MTTSSPGWYSDPSGQVQQRYWDGQSWTAQTRPYPAPLDAERDMDMERDDSINTLPMYPADQKARAVLWGATVLAAVAALALVFGAFAIIWRSTDGDRSSGASTRDRFVNPGTPAGQAPSTPSVPPPTSSTGPAPNSLDQIREISTIRLSDVGGDSAKEVALSPDGSTAYVALEEAGAIQAIDLASQTPGPLVFVGAEPQGVAFSPDGSRIYVGVYSSGELVTLDAETMEELSRVDLGDDWSVFNVAAHPDGRSVYVTRGTESGVLKIDAETGDVIASLSLEGMTFTTGVAVTPDGASLYVSDEQNIHVFDAESGAHIRSFRLPDVERLEFSADGSILMASFFGGVQQGILLLDPRNEERIGVIAPKEYVRGFAVNSDLSRVYMTSGSYLTIAGT